MWVLETWLRFCARTSALNCQAISTTDSSSFWALEQAVSQVPWSDVRYLSHVLHPNAVPLHLPISLSSVVCRSQAVCHGLAQDGLKLSEHTDHLVCTGVKYSSLVLPTPCTMDTSINHPCWGRFIMSWCFIICVHLPPWPQRGVY